ncbi:hypothetical protein F0358_04145 [Empedobacter brevis]|uniref:hypothetical protein n=1 Tax=Empedobacter brevis TaxID=247 RepID=UPI00123DD007|nr:hypothetical protein [Empedobacter brevis]QES91960.1 hypothetical protein F0358_04145 [Empedobacter brevis]
MKKRIVGMIALSLLAACQQKAGETEKKITSVADLSEVQELFKNETNELSIYKNNTFELIEKEKSSSHVIKGNVNYERGFEDDQDATVYVLNFDQPTEEHYFVRFSKNDSILFPLDTNKKRRNGSILYREQ